MSLDAIDDDELASVRFAARSLGKPRIADAVTKVLAGRREVIPPHDAQGPIAKPATAAPTTLVATQVGDLPANTPITADKVILIIQESQGNLSRPATEVWSALELAAIRADGTVVPPTSVTLFNSSGLTFRSQDDDTLSSNTASGGWVAEGDAGAGASGSMRVEVNFTSEVIAAVRWAAAVENYAALVGRTDAAFSCTVLARQGSTTRTSFTTPNGSHSAIPSGIQFLAM